MQTSVKHDEQTLSLTGLSRGNKSLLFEGSAKDACQNIGDHLQKLYGALQAERYDFC